MTKKEIISIIEGLGYVPTDGMNWEHRKKIDEEIRSLYSGRFAKQSKQGAYEVGYLVMGSIHFSNYGNVDKIDFDKRIEVSTVVKEMLLDWIIKSNSDIGIKTQSKILRRNEKINNILDDKS